MTQYLKHKFDQLFSYDTSFVNYEELIVTFSKNLPATENEIISMKAKLTIPEDYIDFLKVNNGCTLFQFQNLGGFELLGTKEIESETNFQRKNYKEDWDDSLIVFCKLISEGDFISFRSKKDNSYDVLDCYHDDIPKNWTVICDSFDYFLERLINEKGKSFWL